jgi:hypothetical protein
LSGGGFKPVPDPMPASPRLIAGLSRSASAGPIGCTSGLEALEFGVFDFGFLPGFLGELGVFAISAIWDGFRPEKRAQGTGVPRDGCVVSNCQYV